MVNFIKSLFSSKSSKPEEEKNKNSKKDFEIFKYDGLRAQRMGRPDYAVKCFTEALAIEEDFETLGYLSQLYIQLGDLNQARERLDRMIKLEPTHYNTHLTIANVCFMQEAYSAMEESAKVAIELQPEQATGHYILGKATKGLNNELMAIAYLTKAIALKEDYNEARLLRAEILWELNQLTEARQDIDYVLEQQPDEEAAILLRGKISEALGEQEAAQSDYQSVIEGNPFSEQAYLYLGQLYLVQEKLPEAIALLDEAIELNPHFTAAYQERGRAKLAQGDKEGSVKDLKKALELNPKESQQLDGQFTNFEAKSTNVLGL